jgi:phosphoribosylglycinamide formyltransferase-1
VHLVTEDVDAGPIVAQAAVSVLEGDTADLLRARIQREEHRILPEAITIVGAGLVPPVAMGRSCPAPTTSSHAEARAPLG